MPNWHAKKYGGYDRTSQEAKDNADMMRAWLNAHGWTDNAIAGLLGNVSVESEYNPWRWQGDAVLSSSDPNVDISSAHAYGLFQFDPAGKYIHSSAAQSYAGYSPNFDNVVGNPLDAEAQLAFINAGHGGYYPTTTYNLTLEQFKASNMAADYLAAAWLYNYERPADPSATIEARQENARYWYSYFGGRPVPGFLPVWLLGYRILKKRRRFL